MPTKTITISEELFKRLQGYAVPLEDTIETVITRLCDRWDRSEVSSELFAQLSPAEVIAQLSQMPDSDGNIWTRVLHYVWNDSSAIDASLTAERVRNMYLESVTNRAHSKATERPYEIQVEAGEAAKFVEQPSDLYKTSRSVYLPIGSSIKGEYQGEEVFAAITVNGIEYSGKFYDNPSSAAVAAKISKGAGEKQAQTNGWQFWKIELPPNSGMWEPLDVLRDAQAKAFA